MRHQTGQLIVWLLCWTVSANPGRVIDGDTFDASASIWLGLAAAERIRVLGVDAPEMRICDPATKKCADNPDGLAAKAFAETWLAQGPIELTACKRDSFGRLLATVMRGSDNLALALIAAGHGVPR